MGYVLYEIKCAANGKAYVGYTSKTAEARFEHHLQNARWKRKTVLYDAIRKYGADQFSVREVLTCDEHFEACEHERRLIAEQKSLIPLGYNMTHGGDGVPLTREQIDAANAKKRGRPLTEKQLAAAERRRGTKASEETRAKLSAVRRGRKQSAEQVRKRVEALLRRNAAVAGVSYEEYARSSEMKRARTKARAVPRVSSGPRVWTAEEREVERQRALVQWTPEARAAACERAAKQWTPEARERKSEAMRRHYAQRKNV